MHTFMQGNISGQPRAAQPNELIDAAMALSGHPRFDMPDCGWTDEETDFLMLFAKEG